MSEPTEGRWQRLARGEARGVGDRLAAAGLRGLSVAYGAALKLHLAGYRLGLARRTRLPALVVSIGNLTVGGTGKTTAAIAVAEWLAARGHRVAYLSRGYRGASELGVAIVSDGRGPLLDAAIAGDEPVLAARQLPGIAVIVGKDRRRTGALAIQKLKADALVLDDGFQYQRLCKDIEIVLVDVLNPFGYDCLVPRGLLREPPRHLARADAVWITHSDLVRRSDRDAVISRVRELAPHALVWETVHLPVGLRRLDAEGDMAPASLRGRRVCALSSVGNPLAFERTLQRLGADLVAAVRFPDHHRYRQEELRALADGPARAADWIVTTEKDAVRLPAGPSAKPIWSLEVALAEAPEAPTLSEELTCLLSQKKT